LGDLFRRDNPKRRHIAKINLSLCFPEFDEETRQRMLVEHFRAYGRSVIDLGLVWWASPNRLERLCQIHGLEAWLDQANAGEQTLLVTPHTTGMDMGGVCLSRFYPLVSMMKRARNPLLNWRLWRGRCRFGAQIVLRDEGIRPLVRSMIQGRAGYLMPDEDLHQARTVFAPFFGIQTATLSVIGRLSRITGAKVLPMFTRRLCNGHYEVDIQPPLKGFPTGDDMKDASRVNEIFESGIRLDPEQYLWTLQWFKNRPDSATSPYA
jgi:lauroyl/myristoyl acyltransferase